MSNIRAYRLRLLHTATSILTHMQGTEGNEGIVARERVLHDGRIVNVPFISGNSFRHKAIREPGARWLIQQIGREGSMTYDQACYACNGGTLTESSISENIGKISAMQELFPLFRLLGGSLRNQVIGGSLYVGRAILVCEENRERLDRMIPDVMEGVGELRPAETFVGKYQYTRGDIAGKADTGAMLKPADDLLGESSEKSKTSQMIYSGQGIIPGSSFYEEIAFENVSPLEIGAVLWSFELWNKAGGRLGGMGRVGHGSVSTSIMLDPDVETEAPEKLVTDYIEHVTSHSADCSKWFDETFPERPAKASKSKK